MNIRNPAFTFSCDSPFSLSLLLNMFANIPDNLKPIIPFVLIKLIASQQWKAIMNITSNATPTPEKEETRINTSCVLSSYATMICLLGKESAEKFYKQMTNSTTYSFETDLPSGKKKKFKIANVFDGDVVRELRNDKTINESNWLKKAEKCIRPYAAKFFAYTNAELNKNKNNVSNDTTYISAIGNVFKNLQYDFNESTLVALKSEILDNEKNIDFNKSFMYWIGISCPSGNDLTKPGFHHVFLIEQFKLNDKVRYRIYQSWIQQGTLLEDIDKHQYGIMGANSLTHQGLISFLDKFESLYSRSKNAGTNITPKECFGYSAKVPDFVKFDGGVISGLNVRYCAIPMNPNDCINNFIEFAKSEPDLQSKTFRLGS